MMSKDKPETIVKLETAHIKAEPNSLVPWLSDNYAEDWFEDAAYEALNGRDYHSIRREIIFSVCFAESYIFEWVRGITNIEELNDYFPIQPRSKNDPGYRRKLIDKWNQIPNELFEAGKLQVNPKLDLSGLKKLLKYRHGLIHASGSRPDTKSLGNKAKPFPTKEDLKKIKSGWAINIVMKLVMDLHNAIGTSPPNYFMKINIDH